MTGTTYCDIAYLRGCFAEGLWGPRAGEDAALGAVREAHDLGRRAYERSIPRDAATAERLLYFIHRNNAFAPPVAAIPAVIWGILVQTKLDNLLPPSPTRELTLEEMVDELQRGVKEGGTHIHPLLDDLARDESLRGYKVFLKNWYGMASGFNEFLASVAQRATRAMKREIHDNLSDEIFDDTPHIDLRARVLEGAGTRFDELRAVDDPDIATEAFALINWRAAASALPNPCLALGLFYSIEANWQYEARRHYAALKALGVPDASLTSLSHHIERDEDHAGGWLEMIKTAVSSPRGPGLVVSGRSAEFAVRRRMYDAIRRYLYER
jgi:pyrroloquinoline quinone (PQQ) biosynthesis protein C